MLDPLDENVVPMHPEKPPISQPLARPPKVIVLEVPKYVIFDGPYIKNYKFGTAKMRIFGGRDLHFGAGPFSDFCKVQGLARLWITA